MRFNWEYLDLSDKIITIVSHYSIGSALFWKRLSEKKKTIELLYLLLFFVIFTNFYQQSFDYIGKLLFFVLHFYLIAIIHWQNITNMVEYF